MTLPVLRSFVVTLGVVFSFVLFSDHVSAATTVNGTLPSGENVWSPAGSPYLIQNVSLPAGSSLTIKPGTVVKVYNAWAIYSYGTLTIGVDGADPVIFTSYRDDTYGGDTNNDGNTSSPSSTGDWYGIYGAQGTINITNTKFLYGGFNVSGAVSNYGADVTISKSEFGYSNHNVLVAAGTTRLSESSLHGSGEYALFQKGGSLEFGSNIFKNNAQAVMLVGGNFKNNGGNSGEGGIFVRGELSHDMRLSKDSLAYVLDQQLKVSNNLTLTIDPGVVVKMWNFTPIMVEGGNLVVGAPNAERTIITSVSDDSVLGDSNRDGAGTPAPGNWCSIDLGTGTATIINTTIRYGGGCPTKGQIMNYGNTLTISDSELSSAGYYALYQGGGSLSMERTEVTGSDTGIRYAGGTVAKLVNNSIHGNAGYGINNTSPDQAVIDARNNWWGNATGPTHSSNQGGVGDRVSDFILFDPWLQTDPFAVNTCTEKCYSNILFLPGIEASRLYINGEQHWEPYKDADVADLELDANGKSVNKDVVTKDVVDSAYRAVNIYASFLDDLDDWKNKDGMIAHYAIAPYDWRLSLEDIIKGGAKKDGGISYIENNSAYLKETLKDLAITSKTGKVTIVAHSNGGLVAKRLLSELGDIESANLVDKLVFVAVPQTGTPKAVGALLHGYDLGLPKDWMPFFLSRSAARKLANNMPGTYNLLPSEAYFVGEGSETRTPVITFDPGDKTDVYINRFGKKIDNFSELQEFLKMSEGKVDKSSTDLNSPVNINSQLLADAETTHGTIDDNWNVPAGIQIYQIAGFGEDTVGTIHYWTGKKCVQIGAFGSCAKTEPAVQYTPEMVVDGDGTVVAPSALAMNSNGSNVQNYWIDLNKYNKQSIDREHADILEVPMLRDFIKENILTNNFSSLPDFITSTVPDTSSKKRLRYYLHSPLTLSVSDTEGHTVSEQENTLPGARFERFGEVQYISVPADIHPKLTLDGEAEGSFTLEVEEVEGNDVAAKTTFEAIPSTTDTVVTMDFPDGSIEHAESLQIDYEGDGKVNFELEPKVGEVVTLPPLDQIPPEAQIFFNTEMQSLDVIGIDENGPVTVSKEEVAEKKKGKILKQKVVTVTLTDQANNKTEVVYSTRTLKPKGFEAVQLQSISYNGEKKELDDTGLKYLWFVDKKSGKYRIMISYLYTPKEKLSTHYLPRKNETVILSKATEPEEMQEEEEIDNTLIKERFPGLIVPMFETKEGEMVIKY